MCRFSKAWDPCSEFVSEVFPPLRGVSQKYFPPGHRDVTLECHATRQDRATVGGGGGDGVSGGHDDRGEGSIAVMDERDGQQENWPVARRGSEDGAAVLAQRRGAAHRPRGESWQHCQEQHDFIKRYLDDGVRLSKVRKLLRRQGVC